MTAERITAEKMVSVVKATLAQRPDQSATLPELFEIVPYVGCLSSADRERSTSRNEERWRQTLRSIFTHTFDGLERDGRHIRLTQPPQS